MIRIELDRKEGDFGFEARDANGHTVKLDSSPESGGINYGVRPMQMLLMGLGGCSGIDIVSILKKQRQQVDGFRMSIDGEREPGVEPSLWKDVKILFELEGNIDLDKAKKACQLSMDKYCSVAETLRRSGTKLTWEVRIAKSGQRTVDSGQ
jgi:putative redox protein